MKKSIVLVLSLTFSHGAFSANEHILQFQTSKRGLIQTLDYLIQKKHPISQKFKELNIRSGIEYSNELGVLKAIVNPLFSRFRQNINNGHEVQSLIYLNLINQILPMSKNVLKRELGINKSIALKYRYRPNLTEFLLSDVKLNEHVAIELNGVIPNSFIHLENYNFFSYTFGVSDIDESVEYSTSLFGIRSLKRDDAEIAAFRKSLLLQILIYANGGIVINTDDVINPRCDIGCGIVQSLQSSYAEDLAEKKQVEKEKREAADRAEQRAQLAEEKQAKAEEDRDKAEVDHGPSRMRDFNSYAKYTKEMAERRRAEAEAARKEAEDAEVDIFENLDKDRRVIFVPIELQEESGDTLNLFPGIKKWELKLLTKIKVSDDRGFEEDSGGVPLTAEQVAALKLEQIINTGVNDEPPAEGIEVTIDGVNNDGSDYDGTNNIFPIFLGIDPE